MTDCELVAVIAEKVMGWRVRRMPTVWYAKTARHRYSLVAIWGGCDSDDRWDPLHDWNDMRDVVDKMRLDKWNLELNVFTNEDDSEGAEACFYTYDTKHKAIGPVCRAVLLAALAAKGVEVTI